jgi:hypothetical protein
MSMPMKQAYQSKQSPAPHPQVIPEEVAYRGVTKESGKPLRLSDGRGPHRSALSDFGLL